MRMTTDFSGATVTVPDNAAEMRNLGHRPKTVSVRGMKMQQCRVCGARLGSFKSGRVCEQ